MLDHSLLTFTNLAALPSIITSFQNRDYTKSASISLATIFSMFHHATETRFYGPALINLFNKQITLHLDQFFASSAIMIVGNKQIIADYWKFILSLFGALLFSEVICYRINFATRFLRVLAHSYWHCGGFYLAFVAVTKYNKYPSLLTDLIRHLGKLIS